MSTPRVSLVIAAIVAAAACGRNPDVAKRQLVTHGKAFAAEKKFAEATIEYRKAIQLDARFAEAYFLLGQAYAANGDPRNALPAYTRAADLAPDDVEASLQAGNLLLVARHFEDAKSRAGSILDKHPSDVRALVLLGNALAGLTNLDDAVVVAQRAAQLDPTRPGLESNVGVLELARGNATLAESAFKRAVARNPKAIEPRRALANFYQNVGRFAEAEDSLRAALALDPAHPRVNQSLGALLIGVGRPLEAEPFLKIATDAIGTVEVRLSMADYYLSIGKVDASVALLRQVASVQEGFVAGRTRLATIAYAAGKPLEAHRLITEILAREPRNATALALEGRLLLAEHHVDEALSLAKAALAADERSAQAYVTLGYVQLERRATEDARKAFSEALNNDPTSADAQLELAKIYLARRDVDTSIDFAERAVKVEPNNLDAHLTLVRSLMVRPGDLPRAEAEVKRLVAAYPGVPDVQSAFGTYLMARGEYGPARRAFSRALELQPSHIDALGGLAALDFSANRGDEARVRIEAALAASQKPSESLLVLAAKVYAASGQPEKTEAMLRRFIEREPGNLAGYSLLGQFYVTMHKLEAAKAEFSEIARREPTAVAAHTMLGFISQATGDIAGAKKAYQAAVQGSPHAAAAANNLAWLYATSGGNLDTALQLAQTANALLPDSTEVGDTLAYVYYKKDLPGFAIPILTRCIQQDGRNPLYQFHLGLVYAHTGENAKAQALLTGVLKANPTFEGADEAKRTLAKLVYQERQGIKR